MTARLAARDVPARLGSRRAELPFDWERPATWGPVLDGVRAAYIAFHPDLAVPEPMTTLLDYLFREVLDGRNAYRCDGVRQALGREARDFRVYARAAADAGAWQR